MNESPIMYVMNNMKTQSDTSGALSLIVTSSIISTVDAVDESIGFILTNVYMLLFTIIHMLECAFIGSLSDDDSTILSSIG